VNTLFPAIIAAVLDNLQRTQPLFYTKPQVGV
jgi:hypothetical protein